jgi:hypothetical protein
VKPMPFYVSAEYAIANPSRPSGYRIASEQLDTKAEAEVIAQAFPGASKVTVVTISGPWKGYRYFVQSSGKLASDDVNLGKNETAIARYKKTMAIIDRFFTSTWRTSFLNSYPSRADLEAVL